MKELTRLPKYLICPTGRVWSTKRTLWLKCFSDKDGYQSLAIKVNGKNVYCRVHRLVAEAYIAPYHGEIVDHIDGDPANNHVDNLRWGTVMQNTRWARQRKQWSSQPPKDLIMRAIAKTLTEQYSCAEVGKCLRVSSATIVRWNRDK